MCTDTTKRTPHPHAEVIKAWADGAKIQYRSKKQDSWHDVSVPAWHPSYEYRVKSEPFKTEGHRRYVFYYPTVGGRIYAMGVVIEKAQTLSPQWAESRGDFVKWIDTEWQYHEIYPEEIK